MTSSSSPAVLANQLKAIRDKFLIPTPDKDHTDYAVMTRCIEALGSSPKTAIPAPADGQVSSQREGENPALEVARRMTRHLAADYGADSDKTNGARMVLAALICDPEVNSPADQSSDVSGLVEGLEAAVGRSLDRDFAWWSSPSGHTARAEIYPVWRDLKEALAQAKRDVGP